MESLVKVTYERQSVTLPKDNLNGSEIAKLFNLNENGLHLKIKQGSGWENLWPDSAMNFSIPSSVNAAMVIAIRNQRSFQNPEDLVVTNATRVNSFTSSFSRGNMAAFTNNGTRTVPPLKRQSSSSFFKTKRNKSELPNYKFFMLSDISGNDPETIEDVYDVPVDLNKLHKQNVDFTINDIQEELAYQLSQPDTIFVITNKKGNPVRDMPNTRGRANWDNCKSFRAIPAEKFKEWRPTIYKELKQDYFLLNDDDDDSDILPSLGDLFSATDVNFPRLSTQQNNGSIAIPEPPATINLEAPSTLQDCTGISTTTLTGNQTVVTLEKEEIFEKLNSIERKVDNRLQSVRSCFKCYVYLEINPQFFMCCLSCGRYIGCFDCVKKLEVCPQCREPLQSFTCGDCGFITKIKKAPLFVPELAKSLDLPEIERPNID